MKLKHVMDSKEMDRAITRIAYELVEKNEGTKNLAIVGIRTGGAILAQRIHEKIEKQESVVLPFGILDITLYRDDLVEIGPQPLARATEIDFDINSKRIILVDDVLFTGRTIRCALDEIIDFGRPKSIELAVLVDRGHRELPIKADYVGTDIATTLSQEVIVRFKDDTGKDEVVVARRKSAGLD